jgi:cystathionine gamma-lyase
MESALKQLPESVEHREGMTRTPGVSTRAIHTGHDALDHPGLGAPVIPPMTLSTTYQQTTPGVYKYDYSRANNYSREVLEKTIAALENGQRCSTFASGLAATTAVIQLLNSGDNIIAFDDLYGGTNRLMRQIIARTGVTTEFVDLTDTDRLKPALKSNTKLLWLESPSNPTMKMVDIKKLTDIAHEYDPNIIVVVDNTFMSSCFQNPLNLGADIVLHSITKYMNGHTDVVMGALIMKDIKLAERLAFIQFAAGAVPSPFDCYQVLRGLRTLGVRMREHMKNGLAVGRYLEAHDKVEKVLHPGKCVLKTDDFRQYFLFLRIFVSK